MSMTMSINGKPMASMHYLIINNIDDDHHDHDDASLVLVMYCSRTLVYV